MRLVAALLAAVLASTGLAACGGDGAEPGASREATLVLDFQPNAVHSGIYAALADGAFADNGVELTIREPGSSTDAPKLLASGRTEFAILDIHDLALARERGIDVVGVSAIAERPLAAVIAADRGAIRTPADLSGKSVGVTGLPSDDAVLDAVLAAGNVDPADVDRVTIGFDSIAALSAGKVDAATAFWNAEGVALQRLGTPTREFRVDDFGAPRYPELIVATSPQTLADDPELVAGVLDAIRSGYESVVADPDAALAALLDAVPELDAEEQGAQLDALVAAHAFEPAGELDRKQLAAWAAWDLRHRVVDEPIDINAAFPTSER